MGGADESVKMSTSPTLLLDTRSAVHSTPTAAPEVMTTTTEVEVIAAAASDDWNIPSGDEETVAAVPIGEEDVTAELSAPVAVTAGFQWQLLAAAGAGVAVFLLLALVLAYRWTGRGSPSLHKVIQHDDAECPPLLDYTPRPLDFAKYLGTFQSVVMIIFAILKQQPI